MIVLQKEITLDEALIKGIQTFYNGCNFRIWVDSMDQMWLEMGCYGVHTYLANTHVKLLLNWLGTQDKKFLPVFPRTRYEILKRKPCLGCGAPFFEMKVVENE